MLKKLKLAGKLVLISSFTLNVNIAIASDHRITKNIYNIKEQQFSFSTNNEYYTDNENLQLILYLSEHYNIPKEEIVNLANTIKQELHELGASELKKLIVTDTQTLEPTFFIQDQNNKCFRYTPQSHIITMCSPQEEETVSNMLEKPTINPDSNLIKAEAGDFYLGVIAIALGIFASVVLFAMFN